MRKVILAALLASGWCGSAGAVTILNFEFYGHGGFVLLGGGQSAPPREVDAPFVMTGTCYFFVGASGYCSPLGNAYFDGNGFSFEFGQVRPGYGLGAMAMGAFVVPTATPFDGQTRAASGTAFYVRSGEVLAKTMTITSARMTLSEGDPLAFATVSLAIPEPATWAMLIGGFAVVGGALRRRVTAAYS